MLSITDRVNKRKLNLKVLQRSLGITFIFVTHDQNEALFLSDRIVVFFEDGKIIQQGSLRDIHETPVEPIHVPFYCVISTRGWHFVDWQARRSMVRR